jgi:hypothetical protein
MAPEPTAGVYNNKKTKNTTVPYHHIRNDVQ